MALHGFFALCLDHHPRQRLGAGVANHNPPRIPEFFFRCRNQDANRREVAQRLLLPHPHIQDHLGERLEIRDQFTQRLPAAMDHVQHQQRRQQAITRSRLGREQDVPRLLAPQRRARLQHLFEHILVAHRCPQHGNPRALERRLQSHVRHRRCHHEISRKQPASLQIARAYQHHGIAVHDIAVFIRKERAVGVAIERHTHRRPTPLHLTRNHAGMHRSTVIVDVPPIRRSMDHVYRALHSRKQRRSHGTRCAIRTVDHDDPIVQRNIRHSVQQKLDILRAKRFIHSRESMICTRKLLGRLRQHKLNLLFHRQFDRITQLEAISTENLDPIVLPRIMRSRNHHACAESMLTRQKRYSRSRNHARVLHLRSSGAQTCCQNSCDPRSTLPRIHPHHNPRAIAQRPRQRLAYRKNRAPIQRSFPRNRTYPIRSEHLSHRKPLRSLSSDATEHPAPPPGQGCFCPYVRHTQEIANPVAAGYPFACRSHREFAPSVTDAIACPSPAHPRTHSPSNTKARKLPAASLARISSPAPTPTELRSSLPSSP